MSTVNINEVYDFPVSHVLGIYIDGEIILNMNRIETEAQYNSIVAEELGHHYTTAGNILDFDDLKNRKQEVLARRWGYKSLVTPDSLIQAYKAGCKNRFEIAEFLNITETFLEDALISFRERYGPFIAIDQFIITLDPLGVIEKFSNWG